MKKTPFQVIWLGVEVSRKTGFFEKKTDKGGT